MEIEFKDVIERVGAKMGQLQIDNDILTLQVERLQARVQELEADTPDMKASTSNGRQDVVDAEVVKD